MSRLYPQPVTMQPAHWQLGRGLRSRQEADRAAAREPAPPGTSAHEGPPGRLRGDQQAREPLQKQLDRLHRLLLLEESAMEADICRCCPPCLLQHPVRVLDPFERTRSVSAADPHRLQLMTSHDYILLCFKWPLTVDSCHHCRHDMFHVRLQYAMVPANRQCRVYSNPSCSGEPLQTVLYTGPALSVILAASSAAEPPEEHTLAALEIPGLPEVGCRTPAHTFCRGCLGGLTCCGRH